jgi:hypothetical protein
VDIHATDLVGINGITRDLSVYTVSKVCDLEATYSPFDSCNKFTQTLLSGLRKEILDKHRRYFNASLNMA